MDIHSFIAGLVLGFVAGGAAVVWIIEPLADWWIAWRHGK